MGVACTLPSVDFMFVDYRLYSTADTGSTNGQSADQRREWIDGSNGV